MSEVKPVHRYKAQTLFSFGGAKIEYFPHGPEVVLATEFDAQRLRADTAEAEREALREAMAERDKKDEARLADRAELIDGFNARLGKNSAKLKALVDRNTRLKYRINSAEQRIAELEKDAPVEPFNLDGWGIDHSAGRPVLVHNKCSVIEAEQAYGLLELINAAKDAPAVERQEPDAIIEGCMTSVGITHAIYASTVTLKDKEQVRLYREPPEVAALQSTIAQLQARIAELESEDFPPCDYCGTVPDYHPWHGAGLINGKESPHIHACTECRHKLPGPVSVVLPERMPGIVDTDSHEEGWNACLDATAALNEGKS